MKDRFSTRKKLLIIFGLLIAFAAILAVQTARSAVIEKINNPDASIGAQCSMFRTVCSQSVVKQLAERSIHYPNASFGKAET